MNDYLWLILETNGWKTWDFLLFTLKLKVAMPTKWGVLIHCPSNWQRGWNRLRRDLAMSDKGRPAKPSTHRAWFCTRVLARNRLAHLSFWGNPSSPHTLSYFLKFVFVIFLDINFENFHVFYPPFPWPLKQNAWW